MSVERVRKGSKKRARSAAASGGARELLRSSNTAIVTQRNLLHFGLDWLALFIGFGNSNTSGIHQFLEEVFDYYDPESGFSDAQDISWPNTSYLLSVRYKQSKGDLMAYFALEGERIIAVRKITLTSTYPQSVTRKFQYHMSFYGTFFALARLGSLRVENFTSVLVSCPALSIVSQIHVCFDVEGLTVNDIWNSVQVSSPSHAKEHSVVRTDPITGLHQTVYYGQKGDPLWFIRIYNKIFEIANDHTQRHYPQYWGKKCVTRLELVIKRSVLKSYEVTIQNCFDESLLLSLLNKTLIGKYVQWGCILSLIEVLSERGMKVHGLTPVKIQYEKLSEEKRYQRFMNQLQKFSSDYGLNPPVFLRHLADEYEAAFPKK